MTVNQQVILQDPIAGTIYKTLNDLSQGEFDVVISDVESSITQRQAQLWNLIDAVSKLQIPGDMIFDVLVDLSDIPKKQDIMQRWQQRQQQQQMQAQQQAQAQLEIEKIKNENLNQSITFKDAALPIQLAMCAKQGLVDPQIAQYFMQTWIAQLAPQLAVQMQQQQMQAAIQQQVPQVQMQMPISAPQQVNQQTIANQKPLTEAAINGIREQLIPAI